MRRAPKVDATQRAVNARLLATDAALAEGPMMPKPRAIEFTVPAVPVSRNRIDQHWALRAKEDARWRGMVALYAPLAAVRFNEPVIVTLTFYAPRPCDPDNLARQVLNALKPYRRKVGGKLLTAFEGLIDDDDWRTVVELRLRSRKGSPRTTVRIEAAEALAAVGVA
jgi:hypothetical protein